jgi:hypothetical protein
LAHATTGELGHGILVETAGGRILEKEVGGGQGRQSQGEEGELHCEGGGQEEEVLMKRGEVNWKVFKVEK